MGITAQRNKFRAAFDAFWAEYPKHSKIDEAEVAFYRVCEKGTDPAELVLKARAYARTVDPEDLRYVPAPSAWLRDGAYANADLFTTDAEEERAWFKKQWETANVTAVENRYQVTFPKAYPPDDITSEAQFNFWFREKCREWIAEVYRSKVECQPTTSEQSSLF
ncbi:hypothetical protein EniyanLRS_75 [Mycobacterium phage EniyanLRS]|uniref:Uncharacterized protein n=1 Tax=Mycobacterium phage EniyanLRS TaxID=1933770 RepID=A0A2I2MPH4_9CAUD|nr:hypothetical protein EniyanLRS_75 [Mycobacterium phage EniyanLRS]